MWQSFQGVYFPESAVFRLRGQELHTRSIEGSGRTDVTATLEVAGEDVVVKGEGDGPVEAFVHALCSRWDIAFDVVDYSEHAIGSGADARAVAYVESSGDDGALRWGIGVDSNITTASLLAVLAAFERQYQQRS
jgi:2-isopropylmalate synthase